MAASIIASSFHSQAVGFSVQTFTWWSYLLTQAGVLVHYLRLAVWPLGLCFDYDWPAAHSVGEVLLPAIVVVGLLGLTIWALVKRPAWGFVGLGSSWSLAQLESLSRSRMPLPSIECTCRWRRW